MRAVLLALAVAFPAPCAAQVVSPRDAGDASARAAAAEALSKANAACMPMAAIPPTETVGGAAGSGSTCRLANAIQPRISRTVAFTTAANGSAVVTWADMGLVPLVFPIASIANAATQVPACYPVSGTITSTGVTIKCFVTQSILGLGLAPFTSAAAGVTGQVLALPVS